VEGQKSGGRGRKKNSPANLPGSLGGEARDKLAEIARVSPRTMEHAMKVADDGCQRVNKMVINGDLAPSAAAAFVAAVPDKQKQHNIAMKGSAAVAAEAKKAAAEKKKPRSGNDIIRECIDLLKNTNAKVCKFLDKASASDEICSLVLFSKLVEESTTLCISLERFQDLRKD
jgi:hypothetical protein